MGLAYSGGTVAKSIIDGSTGTTIQADLVTELVACGWTSSVISGGNALVSATTSQGLSMRLDVVVSAGNCIVTPKTSDGATSLTSYTINASGGRTYYLLGNRYSCWLLLNGTTVGASGQVTAFYCGVPWLPEPVEPLVVNAASNTSPIVITTTTDHNLTNGETVYVTGVGGNTAANGQYIVTTLTDTTFSLNGSVGNGDYTSGGLVGNDQRVSRAIYAGANTDGTFASSWRANPVGTAFGSCHLILNEANFAGLSNQLQLLTSNGYPWRETRLAITEPYVYAPIVNGGTKQLQFQLWNAALISGTPAIAIDTITSFDGHSWQCYGTNSTCALMVAFT